MKTKYSILVCAAMLMSAFPLQAGEGLMTKPLMKSDITAESTKERLSGKAVCGGNMLYPVAIDTAMNAYGMLNAGVNPIFYEPWTGNLVWAGRALGEQLSGSGVLGFNYSTDGGATWPNRQIDLNEPNHTTGARHPSALAIADYPIIIYSESYTGLHPILMWDFGWGMGLWTYNDFYDSVYSDLGAASPVVAVNGNIFISFQTWGGGDPAYISYLGNTSDLTLIEVNPDASVFPEELPNGLIEQFTTSYDYTGGGYMVVGGVWVADSSSSSADERNLAYKISDDNGETWSDLITISEADIAGFPTQSDSSDAFFQSTSVKQVVGPDGQVHFFGNVISNDSDKVYVSHVGKEGDTWTLHVIDEMDIALSGGALCAGCEWIEPVILPPGLLLVFYTGGTALTDTVPGGMIASDIFFSGSQDGSVWMIPENITYSPGIDELFVHASPIVETDSGFERIHLVYFVDIEAPVGDLSGKHVYYHTSYEFCIPNVSGENILAPYGFHLERNYPNPFNPVTEITYSLPAAGHTKLTIYNILGREVARPVDGFQLPGRHKVRWDAGAVASGVYFYRLESGGFSQTRKMVVLR